MPKYDTRTVQAANALCEFLMDPLPATGSMLPLIAAEIYDRRPDLQNVFPGAHTATNPDGFWRWFCRHAGCEYGIDHLIERFRRVLVSSELYEFTGKASAVVGNNLRLLSSDRQIAADQLRSAGEDKLAVVLLEAQSEWYFFTDIEAALRLYSMRPGLRETFPDILGADHAAFCQWLSRHAPQEHACPPHVGAKFRRYSAGTYLSRVSSPIWRGAKIYRARARTSCSANIPSPCCVP